MANEFKIKKGLIVNGSGSTILDIQGSQGQLFSVTDNLSGSLFSVNDISGLPILQVSSDDSVKLGTYNAEAIKVSGSNAIITGSLFGTASWAISASYVSPTTTNAFIQGGNSFGTTALLGTNDNQALALETNGTTKMFISSSGNVGIGTTSPLSRLQVRTNTDQNFRVSSGTTLEVNSINDADSAYTPLTFRASTYNFANGNVGIGTTSPGSKLDVNGDIGYLAESAIYPRQKSVASDWYLGKFNGGSLINNALGASGDNAFQIGYYGGGTFAPNIKLSAGGNNISYINSGSVGIGTTTPTQKLDVIGSTKTDVLYLGSTSNYLDIATGMRLRSDANGINFVPNGTQAVKITGAGDVGIGKTTPNAKLDVSGSAIITGSLTVTVGITGSLFGTSSWAVSSSWAPYQVTSSYALTASYAPSYLPLTGGTINGNVTVNGTASIAFLNVQYESASVIYSSGSNVFGDATNDTQTLNGTVLVSGSQQITGSLNVSQGITGSLFGTASYVNISGLGGFVQGGNSFGTTALLGTNDNQSLAFETSGSERMFISSSGFVGIGTTSPRSRFHINSPTDTGYPTLGSQKGSFYLAGDNNLYGLMAGIDASSGTFWMQAMRNDIPTAYNILLNPVGGNVGIGKTVSNAKLDVSGSAIISGSFTVTPGTIREFQVNTTGVDIGNLITDRHTVTGSLNVSGSITGSLFGTSSWAISALTSSHSTNIAGVTNYIAKFTGTNTLSSSLIYDNGTAVMVGTTTPAARLTVTSAGTGTGINGTAIYAYSNGGPTIDAGAANSSSIVATNNSVNSSTLVAQNIGSGPIFSLKNNTDAVVVHVLNNGNVGIGTTTPTLGKLQVSGNVHATSFTGSLFGTSSWAVSASVSVNSKITDNPSFSSTYYPVFVQAAGNTNLQIDTSTFTYNPSTNLLTTTASFALTSSFLNGGTNAFVQNGNSFGTIATLGTNDNQSLQFETNNSTKMFISSSGNVGIGTTSPSERLTVSGSVNINSEGSYMGVDAQATPRLGFVKLSGAQPFLAFAQSSFDLRVSSGTTISTSNTFSPVLTVKTTGEVGIGTTSPFSRLTTLGALSTTTSQMSIVNSEGGHTILRTGIASISNSGFSLISADVDGSNQNTRLVVSSAGNVGIGTTAPDSKLTVGLRASTDGNIRLSAAGTGIDAGASLLWDMNVGGGNAISHLAEIRPESYATGANKNILNFYVGDWNNNANSGTAKMTIAQDGNVGIGTISPQSKLDVSINDNTYATALTLRNTNAGSQALSQIILETASNTSGVFAIRQFNGGGAVELANYANAPMTFWTSGSERMRIAANGNVGIGTTDPGSYKLYVSGTIYATGDVIAFSDESVKENIRPIENVIEKIQSTRGIIYDRIDTETKDNIGFIAQELEVAFPELVVTNEDGTKAVKYQNTVAVLFEAIKEQQKQIDAILKLLDNGVTK